MRADTHRHLLHEDLPASIVVPPEVIMLTDEMLFLKDAI